MALDHDDWNKIYQALEDLRPASEVVQDDVVRIDEDRKVIFTKEFGDTPIPIYAFRYEIKYYDESTRDTYDPGVGGQPMPYQVFVKKAITKVLMPEVGDTVLILKQFGSRRLPKCIGILQSTNFVILD